MTGSAPSSTAAPDWATLTLELHCPRCGYNLRLLPQPRCPECGLQFVWAEVIAAEQRKLDCPLFEYHWRDRPIRSFLVTIWRALLPWRLWTRTPIASEPQVGPLLGLLLIALLLQAAVCLGAQALDWWQMGRRGTWFPPRLGPGAHVWSVSGQVVAALVLWGTLRLYQQTIHQYRVRPGHFLRLIALSGVALIAWHTLAALLTYGCSIVLHSVTLRYWFGTHVSVLRALWRLRFAWSWLPEVLGLAAFAVSICAGLSLYLRIRHGWLMGLLSVIAAALLVLTPAPVLTVLAGTPHHFYIDCVVKLWPGISQVLSGY